MTNYYDEEYIKNLPISEIRDLYYLQYDEDQDIPAIDREDNYESGGYIYKLYIYKLKNGETNYQKYFCRIEKSEDEDPMEIGEDWDEEDLKRARGMGTNSEKY